MGAINIYIIMEYKSTVWNDFIYIKEYQYAEIHFLISLIKGNAKNSNYT